MKRKVAIPRVKMFEPSRPSMHGKVTRVSTITVWAEGLGDAGLCFIGKARCGAHTFTTGPGWFSEPSSAEIAALGLVMAHIASCYYGRLKRNGSDPPEWDEEASAKNIKKMRAREKGRDAQAEDLL